MDRIEAIRKSLKVKNNNGKNHAAELTEHSRYRRARHAELGEKADAENKQRVKNDIYDRAQKLKQHRIDHVAGRLQGLFDHDLNYREQRQAEHAGEILHARVDDPRI